MKSKIILNNGESIVFESRFNQEVMIQNPSGNYADGKVFLIKSDVIPRPGASIVHAGRTYDLKDIKVCRTLDGKVEACRCVVF